MKNFVKFLLPVILFLLPACQREMDMPGTDEQVSAGPVSIAVTIDQDTRTTVSDGDGAIVFSSGDVIKIFNGTGVYWGVTASTTNSGLFSMEEGFTASGNGFAGFPANLVPSITSDGVVFTLPCTYDFTAVGGSDISSSKVPCPMIGAFSGGDGISLKPACAIVRFYLTDVKAGSLVFTFPTPVTGTTRALTKPSGTNDGILASTLIEAGKTITVTGVPYVADGCSICITLPVPTGTKPQNIQVINKPSDDTNVRFAVISGSSASLARSTGHKIMNIPFKDFAPALVDLGLSVKWATMNVGALTETDYGDYFAWGETEPKSHYNWLNYKWCKGTYNSLTKYCDTPSFGYHGFTDELHDLDLSDDAAYVNWGDNWRMPTIEEMEELQALSSEFVYNYKGTGVNGLKFTATNGNSIFFPAAGSRYESDLYYEGTDGVYWSSTCDGGPDAWYFFFMMDVERFDFDYRSGGYSVRPVYQEGNAPTGTLSSVEISHESVMLNPGETQQLTATAKDARGNTIPEADIFWTIEEGLSARVSSTGLVTADTYNSGLTIIRATAYYSGVTVFADCAVRMNTSTAVDLGLSVKWSNMNVGARSETEYGNYFAWGEIKPKDDYSWSTYKWGDESYQTKYNSSDGKTVLDLADDAARYNWGGSWRMPTQAELAELWNTKSNTTDYEWTWYDGSSKKYNNTSVKGWKIMSKKTATYGNHIFIPAAGLQVGTSIYMEGTLGYCWSSSLRTGADAWFYTFSSGDPGFQAYRCYGASVRPVQP